MFLKRVRLNRGTGLNRTYVYEIQSRQTRFHKTNFNWFQLPNYQLEQLELVEHLTVQVQHPDAGPLHARPGCQAEIEPVLQRALADREAPLQLGPGYGRETIPPIQHRVPPVSRRGHLQPTAWDQSPLDLGAGQGRIPVAPIQRRRLPVQILLGDRGAPGSHRVVVKGWADRAFLGLWNSHPDPLGLGARRGDAGHPHLHLGGPLLARPLRTHPRPLGAREQRRRRVTPLQFVVQDEQSFDASPPWNFILPDLSSRATFSGARIFTSARSDRIASIFRSLRSRSAGLSPRRGRESSRQRGKTGKTVEEFLENHQALLSPGKKLIERTTESIERFSPSLPFRETLGPFFLLLSAPRKKKKGIGWNRMG